MIDMEVKGNTWPDSGDNRYPGRLSLLSEVYCQHYF